jgi:hypothetical protein
MKKIVKRIPARTEVLWACGKCRARYNTKKMALECESKPVEKQKFKIGKRVAWCEQKYCSACGK